MVRDDRQLDPVVSFQLFVFVLEIILGIHYDEHFLIYMTY